MGPLIFASNLYGNQENIKPTKRVNFSFDLIILIFFIWGKNMKLLLM